MNKETTDRDMLLVSVFTFLTVSLWIFFELVKRQLQSYPPLSSSS